MAQHRTETLRRLSKSSSKIDVAGVCKNFEGELFGGAFVSENWEKCGIKRSPSYLQRECSWRALRAFNERERESIVQMADG
jgi:hypothetical protein